MGIVPCVARLVSGCGDWIAAEKPPLSAPTCDGGFAMHYNPLSPLISFKVFCVSLVFFVIGMF